VSRGFMFHGEHVGYVSISFAAIDVSDVGVSHFVAARNLLNGPWRRESPKPWHPHR
jgi:hypothetical protein